MPLPVPATTENIRKAAELIRSGGLVAFPTETVYGLGANALDEAAVRAIFAAKGRPSTNPVIAHVANPEGAEAIAHVDVRAKRIMSALWPGPLTLVLPRKSIVPDIVTAGGETVAVRMPRHPIALALLRDACVPIAAPSANRSESLSPTLAEHVYQSLGDSIAMILDGGPTEVGLESIVLDMTSIPARILRPGMADIDEISSVLGEEIIAGSEQTGIAKSPGQMLRHYSPRTPLVLTKDLNATAMQTTAPFAILAIGVDPQIAQSIATIVLPDEPRAYASGLYAALHTLDAGGASTIMAQAPPASSEWSAIWDRLRRAASSN